MTATINVAGPTTISFDLGGGAGFVVLGYSDNDNLPSVSISDHKHEIRTVLSGQSPEEVVLAGTQATISLALVKWDEGNLNDLLAHFRGVYNGSPVGTKLVSGAATFALKIAGTNDGFELEFPVCYVQDNGVSDSQWGNRERVLSLNITAIPSTDATPILYTYASDNLTP